METIKTGATYPRRKRFCSLTIRVFRGDVQRSFFMMIGAIFFTLFSAIKGEFSRELLPPEVTSAPRSDRIPLG